jgi:hypothetical protein
VNNESRYYRARGFSPYYFANAIFNVVTNSTAYMRGIEEILGDTRTMWFAKPYKTYTNLHEFSRSVIEDVVEEEILQHDEELVFLSACPKRYEVPIDLESARGDDDAVIEALGESSRYHDAVDELTDEVFHILFNDVGFLAAFNRLCAGYLENACYDADHARFFTLRGPLRRAPLPSWVRRAIYHRDKGECRSCKKSLAKTINQIDTERYDHIIPLTRFGPNDVTNLQLLCEACNATKSGAEVPVSQLYPKALLS